MSATKSYVLEHEDIGAAIVPSQVMLDARIPIKARGLYAVLRCIPSGTRLNDGTLQSLSHHDGRDAMRSAKRWLCRHGLLSIRQERVQAGRFSRTVWLLRTEATATVDGFSVSGLPVSGKSGRGRAVDGKPGNGESTTNHGHFEPAPDDYRRKRQARPALVRSSTSSNTYKERRCDQQEAARLGSDISGRVPGRNDQTARLIPPLSLPAEHASRALQIVSHLSAVAAQEALDELDGNIRNRKIKKTWEGCLRGIVRAVEHGEFHFNLGREVVHDRNRRVAEAQQAAERAAQRASLKPSNPEQVKAHLAEVTALLKGSNGAGE